MAKKKTVVPFNGTKEQEAQLAAVIEKYKDVQCCRKHSRFTAICPSRCRS